MTAYKKYEKQDQRTMASWAADCAERVLPLFEKARPNDDRPRRAIEECRKWADTGEFKMATIRKASLDAHGAARETEKDSAACFAARAAGQAVGTAHVAQHAFGAAYYALKAIVVADPENIIKNVSKEWEWELQRVPENLKDAVLKIIIIQNKGSGVTIKINKGEGF
ncbi:putative immunity protein [Dehalogenimonas sp. THU2]|uniref:putative immunity protein n=1 Tax=Dehalogenimonas sp. THU2 TaxID=3151121 RepID=UPI003218C3FD